MDIDTYTANITKIHGWCTAAKAKRLYELAKEVSTLQARVMEIGVYAGRSLFPLALAALEDNTQPVIAIDAWDAKASASGVLEDVNRKWWGALDHNIYFKAFDEKAQEFGLTPCIEVFNTTSQDFALTPYFDALKLSLIHIDGSHAEDVALHDVEKFVPKIVDGGTLVFDDLGWKTTGKAQLKIKELGYELVESLDSGNCGVYKRRYA